MQILQVIKVCLQTDQIFQNVAEEYWLIWNLYFYAGHVFRYIISYS